MTTTFQQQSAGKLPFLLPLLMCRRGAGGACGVVWCVINNVVINMSILHTFDNDYYRVILILTAIIGSGSIEGGGDCGIS